VGASAFGSAIAAARAPCLLRCRAGPLREARRERRFTQWLQPPRLLLGERACLPASPWPSGTAARDSIPSPRGDSRRSSLGLAARVPPGIEESRGRVRVLRADAAAPVDLGRTNTAAGGGLTLSMQLPFPLQMCSLLSNSAFGSENRRRGLGTVDCIIDGGQEAKN